MKTYARNLIVGGLVAALGSALGSLGYLYYNNYRTTQEKKEAYEDLKKIEPSPPGNLINVILGEEPNTFGAGDCVETRIGGQIGLYCKSKRFPAKQKFVMPFPIQK